MKLIVFVEEESAQAGLSVLLPKILPVGCGRQIINLQSKSQLLRKIEARLRGYLQQCIREDIRIAVLVDRDRDDCLHLKSQLELAARQAGFSTKSNPDATRSPAFRVLNRVVVEELESWFLGDPAAICGAFPGVKGLNVRKPPFVNPDNGGDWEALERILRQSGYKSNYKKIEGARRIATHMKPAINRSQSFRSFRDGLAELLGQ
jgi:hypothetical protein